MVKEAMCGEGSSTPVNAVMKWMGASHVHVFRTNELPRHMYITLDPMAVACLPTDLLTFDANTDVPWTQ